MVNKSFLFFLLLGLSLPETSPLCAAGSSSSSLSKNTDDGNALGGSPRFNFQTTQDVINFLSNNKGNTDKIELVAQWTIKTPKQSVDKISVLDAIFQNKYLTSKSLYADNLYVYAANHGLIDVLEHMVSKGIVEKDWFTFQSTAWANVQSDFVRDWIFQKFHPSSSRGVRLASEARENRRTPKQDYSKFFEDDDSLSDSLADSSAEDTKPKKTKLRKPPEPAKKIQPKPVARVAIASSPAPSAAPKSQSSASSSSVATAAESSAQRVIPRSVLGKRSAFNAVSSPGGNDQEEAKDNTTSSKGNKAARQGPAAAQTNLLATNIPVLSVSSSSAQTPVIMPEPPALGEEKTGRVSTSDESTALSVLTEEIKAAPQANVSVTSVASAAACSASSSSSSSQSMLSSIFDQDDIDEKFKKVFKANDFARIQMMKEAGYSPSQEIKKEVIQSKTNMLNKFSSIMQMLTPKIGMPDDDSTVLSQQEKVDIDSTFFTAVTLAHTDYVGDILHFVKPSASVLNKCMKYLGEQIVSTTNILDTVMEL